MDSPASPAVNSPSVQRWTRQLAGRVGMTSEEIGRLRAGLDEFCVRHQTDPDTLLATWLDFSELTVRRRPDPGATPNQAVESFLIHNGINVFGDITCVAGRPEDLAEQGAWFVRAAQPPRD